MTSGGRERPSGCRQRFRTSSGRASIIWTNRPSERSRRLRSLARSSRDGFSQRSGIPMKVASVSVNQDEVERAQSNLEAVRRLAQERNDPQRLSLVLYWLGRLAYVLGDSRRAITCAEESLAVAEQLDDATLTAPPVNLMARAYSQLSD